ncbi:hypothetical protein V6N12_016175 [Hibiscus sabdariffa]|uniref:RNase H type-1 domain-containing protein n=1 Tax=Hibiscus sabdariffa TaxID=183260 RepID=A0ABR2C8X8_9ROSI
MFEGQLSQNMVIQNIRATNETEKEIYRYLKVGKPIEIAAFLVVDQEEVTSPSLFRGIFSTSEEVHDESSNKVDTMMSMLRFIEVLGRVGDQLIPNEGMLFAMLLFPFLSGAHMMSSLIARSYQDNLMMLKVLCHSSLASQGMLIELASPLIVGQALLWPKDMDLNGMALGILVIYYVLSVDASIGRGRACGGAVLQDSNGNLIDFSSFNLPETKMKTHKAERHAFLMALDWTFEIFVKRNVTKKLLYVRTDRSEITSQQVFISHSVGKCEIEDELEANNNEEEEKTINDNEEEKRVSSDSDDEGEEESSEGKEESSDCDDEEESDDEESSDEKEEVSSESDEEEDSDKEEEEKEDSDEEEDND